MTLVILKPKVHVPRKISSYKSINNKEKILFLKLEKKDILLKELREKFPVTDRGQKIMG